MEDLNYSALVRERFERPGNAGRLLGDVVTGAAGERAHGARVEFDFRLSGGRVERARFRAYGCPHTIAAASWVAEQAEGRNLEQSDWLDPQSLADVLELPEHKLGVLLVVEDALRDAANKSLTT
ncbi:MAG: iron-sulfur cluster assembly scaffold protein [Gammaproteobacteria bacterium]